MVQTYGRMRGEDSSLRCTNLKDQRFTLNDGRNWATSVYYEL